MAGVSVQGARGGRRTLDSEINMIPMIDLLMVTISFLLITAVWMHGKSLDANANVPAPATSPCEGADCKPEVRLHVIATDPAKFVLAWKEGATVLRTTDVPREYRALGAKMDDEWKNSGLHRDASDLRFDHVVVHTSNDLPYRDVIAIMDAIATPKREIPVKGKVLRLPAFQTTFAAD